MNFGFRYHVASLVAVFFSLILGILIGGALFPDHILVDEQATLISELEERFREVHANLAQVQGELDVSNQAWGQVLDTISKDMLEARTVVFVDVDKTRVAPLAQLLKFAGAEVQEVGAAYLSEVTSREDVVFVFPLVEDTLSEEMFMVLGELATASASLAFIWDMKSKPALSDLPPSLMVDSIDTPMGQLAFIIGLARGSQGHYGRQKDAQGLFP
ncbi:MAG TPA: hypothetical protein DDZ66_05720 [Firmicutes bacterium]|jgi:hypothetical protein|nr:hypothetical protein [Bacillota bacterium]